MDVVSYYFISIFLVYAGLLYYFAVKSVKTEAPDDYIIGGRSVGTFSTMASLVAGFRDGAGIVVWITLAIYFGFGALWLTFGMIVALLLLSYLAPRIRELAAKEKIVTIGDLLGISFGEKTRKTASIIVMCTAALYSAAQIYAAGGIVSGVMQIPTYVGIIVASAIVCGYVVLGGYSTVIKTDIVQWMLIMLIIALPWVIGRGSVTFPELSTLNSPGLQTSFGFAAISFLVVASGADVWQRIFSARSGGAARGAFLLTAPVYLFVSVGMVLFGATAASIVGEVQGSQEVFFSLFASSSFPPLLLAVLGLFSAAAIMSTFDTQILLLSSTVERDLLPRRANIGERTRTRFVVIILTTAITIVASGIGDIVEFLFSAVTLGTVLLPPLMGAFIAHSYGFKLADSSVSIALVASSLVYAWQFSAGQYENVALTVVPSIVCLAIMIIAYIYEGVTKKLVD